MLKVLLIDCCDYWLCDLDQIRDLETRVPPIGLMGLATFLQQKFADELQVRVISRLVDYTRDDELAEILSTYHPHIVGLRGLHLWKDIVHRTARFVKEFDKDILILLGGPYASLDASSALQDSSIDICVIGEGELTLAELIERHLRQKDFSDILGLAFNKHGRILINPPRPFIDDLDNLPWPDYRLISIDRYSHFVNYGYMRRRNAVLFTSRGCPYGCIFCHNIFGKKFRSRSPENVFGEIQYLHDKFQMKDFYIADDSFNLNYQRSERIFDLIIASGLKIHLYFHNGLRGDIMDEALIDKMVEAGTIWIDFAVETACERLQKYIGKNNDLKKLTRNIHYACEKDIMVGAFNMFGFPTETKSEALETIEYLKQFQKLTNPTFHSVKYFPNTKLYELGLKEGHDLNQARDALGDPYEKVYNVATPLISVSDFKKIYYLYSSEIFLSRHRLKNAIATQRKYLTQQEILDYYSICFRKRITDLDKDVLRYAK